MDPRHIQSHGLGDPSDEELERPTMWRFWRALPPKGKIGIFFGSWYTWADPQPGVRQNQECRSRPKHGARSVRFEKMLTDEGALILKFWLHLSKDKQEKRLKALEKNPKTRWRVTERDWKHFKLYDKFRKVAERVCARPAPPRRRGSSSRAPTRATAA